MCAISTSCKVHEASSCCNSVISALSPCFVAAAAAIAHVIGIHLHFSASRFIAARNLFIGHYCALDDDGVCISRARGYRALFRLFVGLCYQIELLPHVTLFSATTVSRKGSAVWRMHSNRQLAMRKLSWVRLTTSDRVQRAKSSSGHSMGAYC